MSNNLKRKEASVFEPQGYISAANAKEFQEELTKMVKNSPNSLSIVDMKKVEFIDSAGLMALASGFRLAQSLGKRFILCGIAPSVRIIFELTQLDKVFEIVDGEENLEAA
jgi:anti-anti-sigma factor